jgi:hypothetical protein
MNQYIKKMLYTLIILAGLIVTVSANAETENIERTFSVSKGGTLILESDMGSIKVGTWDKSEVFVSVKKRASSKERLDRFKLLIEKRGNNIYIKGNREWNSRLQIEFHINVPKEYNVDLKTGGGSIKVADIKGNVKLATSGGSISIGNVDLGDVNAHTSGGSIKVGDVNGNLKVNTSGGSIHLGKVTGTSSINTSGGSISLAQGGRDVKAHTSGGSISIGSSKGKVKADTSGGSINIGMADGNVYADTSGGSVRVKGSKGKVVIKSSGGSLFVDSSGGPVKADTSGGSIKIMQAKGAIDAETSGGSIEAEMIETNNSKDTHVKLHSSGGRLTVYLPDTIEATVSANLKISWHAIRDYQIYSDFPLTIKGEESSRITAKGDINGGGDRIQLSTTDGDIYIKKLEK